MRLAALLFVVTAPSWAWTTLTYSKSRPLTNRHFTSDHIQSHSPFALRASFTTSSTEALVLDSNEDGHNKNTTSAFAFTPDNSTTALSEPSFIKVRRLKDLMWSRETLEDLTAAEFATKVEQDSQKRKRAVDYEKLLTQLNRRIADLGCEEGTSELIEGVGMGSLVYSHEERTELMERIVMTRHALLEVIRENEMELEDAATTDLPFSLSLPDLRRSSLEVDAAANDTDMSNNRLSGPKLYVRDDGTVDWDGALQDQAELRKFGTAVWARINGRDPDSVEDSNSTAVAHSSTTPKEVTVRISETPQIIAARERLEDLKHELARKEADHLALRVGQAVANVKLASLAPEQRNKIRVSAAALDLLKEKVTFQSLIYELERIYTYLLGELGNPALKGYIPLQDRLNVAEFGLLAAQIDSLNRQLGEDQAVDADVLAVVMDQLTDFKRRLGIDYYVTGLSFDSEAIKRWLSELLVKTKKGLAFYVKGVRLFGNDIAYCFRLINRAAQGYTLKPREVRTLR